MAGCDVCGMTFSWTIRGPKGLLQSKLGTARRAQRRAGEMSEFGWPVGPVDGALLIGVPRCFSGHQEFLVGL